MGGGGAEHCPGYSSGKNMKQHEDRGSWKNDIHIMVLLILV